MNDFAKACRSCKEVLPLTEFHIATGNRDGRNTQCKSCRWAAGQKARQSRNFEPDPNATKRCGRCTATKSILEFPRNRRSADGAGSLCKPCLSDYSKEWWQRDIEKNRARGRVNARRHAEKHPDAGSRRARKAQLKKAYGLTVEDYERMEAEQAGLCWICHRTCPSGRRLAVDHDHTTGRVRRLLCASCNGGIGQFQHDADLLARAILYLGKFA